MLTKSLTASSDAYVVVTTIQYDRLGSDRRAPRDVG
jgi:hypothetical protein